MDDDWGKLSLNTENLSAKLHPRGCESKTCRREKLKAQRQKALVWEGLKIIPDICLCCVPLKLRDSKPSMDNLF